MNVGRQQATVKSSSDLRKKMNVLWVSCEVTKDFPTEFSTEMLVNEWLNVHIKLDVHLTDDSSSDC